jgi:putative aldouronate transport system permease protein
MMGRFDTRRDKVFMVVVYTVMILVTVVMLYPFWDQVVLSLSTRAQALEGGFRVWPSPISLDAYRYVLDSPEIWRAALNTVQRVIFGTAWGVAVTALTAYPLSRDDFPMRRVFTIMIVFTMLFSGGLIPDYLLRKELHLLNNPLVLILPGLTAFNIIIMRNFFRSLPQEVMEAAELDGANEWRLFRDIALPLSKPILATMALFIAVAHWNAYFDALIYITDRDKYVLQVVLRRVLLEGQVDMFIPGGTDLSGFVQPPTQETVKAALVMVTTLPVILVYPFLQRFFIKGTLLGAVKE